MKNAAAKFFAVRLVVLSVILGALAALLATGKNPLEAYAQTPDIQQMPTFQKYPSSLEDVKTRNINGATWYPMEGVVRECINYSGVNFIVLETINGKAMRPIVNGIELGNPIASGAG